MPESYRGGKRKTGLIIAAVVAAISVVGLLGSITVGLIYQARYQQYAADRTADYTKYADQKVGNACRGVTPQLLVNCFASERIQAELDKRIYEHDQADLVAQRKAALWTSIMGVAALCGMLLSLAGIWLVWMTFDETRETNKIAREAAKKQLRAYLGIGVPTLQRIKGDRWTALFPLVNSGQTPATDVALSSVGLFTRFPLERRRIEGYHRKTQVFPDIGPEGTRGQRWLLDVNEPMTLALQSGTHCFFCFLQLSYTIYTGERIVEEPTRWIAREIEFDEGSVTLADRGADSGHYKPE